MHDSFRDATARACTLHFGDSLMSQTTERVFETYVEEILHEKAGWKQGDRSEWDKERALFPARVLTFLQTTQQKQWNEMKTLHGAGLESLLITALAKELDLKGSLHVLRHGFKFYGKTFRLAYFKPGARIEFRRAGTLQ